MKPRIEFEKMVTSEARKAIVSSCDWITREDQQVVDLIAARMQNLFMSGLLEGLRIGQEASLKAIKNFGKAVQS